MKKCRKHGFTLIELLVVITIIAILLGLIVPAIFNALKEAERARGANNLKRIGDALITFSVKNGEFPNKGEVDKDDPSWGANCLAILFTHPDKYLDETKLFVVENSGESCEDIDIYDENPFDNTVKGKQCSYGYDSRHNINDPSGVALIADKVIMSDSDMPDDEARQNSSNYGPDRPGQHVYYKNGSVEWKSTPLCGYRNAGIYDHIYTRDEANEQSTDTNGNSDSEIIP